MHGHICNALIQHDKLGKTWKELKEASCSMELVKPLPEDISICRPYMANWGKQLRRASKQGKNRRRSQFSRYPRQLTVDQIVAVGITNNNSNRNNNWRGQDSWDTKRPQSKTDLKLSKTKTNNKMTPTPPRCYKCGKIYHIRLEYCSKPSIMVSDMAGKCGYQDCHRDWINPIFRWA